jgi:hypothetical protein
MAHRLRNLAVAAISAAMLFALAALAVAATPVKGGKYKGTLTGQSGERVTFNVSSNGTKVTNMRVGPYPPNKCGAGGQPPKQSSDTASIKSGKFTAHISYRSTTGKLIAETTVTGEFLTNRKEKGTVKGTISGASQCTGSFPYTTKA